MAERYLDERAYKAGDVVCTEGETTTEMFIIQEGKVAVTKQVAGRDTLIAVLERGDFFGELALLTSQPRHATCTALAPTRLLALRSGELLLKLRRDPTFAVEMLQTMSERIRSLNDHVARLMEKELASREEVEKLLAESTYRQRGGGRS